MDEKKHHLGFRIIKFLNEDPFSHNHGSVENGGISNVSFLSFREMFHFHDCGRKGIQL